MNPTGLDIELCTGCEAPYFLGRGSKFPSGRARKQWSQVHARKKQMQGMTYDLCRDQGCSIALLCLMIGCPKGWFQKCPKKQKKTPGAHSNHLNSERRSVARKRTMPKTVVP